MIKKEIQKITRKNTIVSFLVFFIAITLIFLGNAKFLMNHCLSVFNYGIFQQALLEIASGSSLNPFVSVRGLHIFNDHFPLILFLVAPFIKITQYHPLGLLIWEYFCFLSLFFIFIKKAKYENEKAFWIGALAIIFTKGLLKAMELPGHPGVWAILPLFLIPYYLRKEIRGDERVWKWIFFLSFSLGFFRESYAFMILGLSSFYYLNKKWKKGLTLTCLGLSWIIIVYKIRPYFLGEVYDYGGEFTNSLLLNPFGYTWERALEFDYKGLFKTFYPFLIPLYFLFKEKRPIKELPITGVLLMIAPLFYLHFLANKFSFQYGPMFVAPLLGSFIFSSLPDQFCRQKRVGMIVMILFIASSSGRYTKMVKRLCMNDFGNCETSKKKRISSKKVYKILDMITLDQRIMATGGIIPRILKPGIKLYHPAKNFNIVKEDSFDYLLLERNSTGGSLPLYTKDVEEIFKRCEPFINQILIKDYYYYFLKGNFPKSCIGI